MNGESIGDGDYWEIIEKNKNQNIKQKKKKQ